MKEVTFEAYELFTNEYYPKSYFLKTNPQDRAAFFKVINEGITFCNCFLKMSTLTKCQTELLSDLKMFLIRILYIVPNNDDFQFNALMRATTENILRLIVASSTLFEIKEIKRMGFARLKKEIKSLEAYTFFKYEIDSLYSLFGKFSQEIHSQNSSQTFTFLVNLRSNPPLVPLRTKTRDISTIQKTFTNSVSILLGANTKTLDTGSLILLHRVLGNQKYDSLPIFNEN